MGRKCVLRAGKHSDNTPGLGRAAISKVQQPYYDFIAASICVWFWSVLTYHVVSMAIKTAVARVSSLDSIFDELKAILGSHAAGLLERAGTVKNKRDYQLNSKKPVVVDGRKRDEMYFAGLIQQKASVGFYFFPIYCCDDVKAKLSPDLLKHLDGKACFHFKTLTPELKKDVQAALKVGLKAYREKKWI